MTELNAKTIMQFLSVSTRDKPKDGNEKMQFYYHPDHLGSSSYITNLDGEVTQHIEYVPFGEVFIEERNDTWNTPYLFNAKEFDEETGMYYYGARYYEPRLSLWMGTDIIEEKHPDISSYCFVFNNPIKLIDSNGMDWEDLDGNKITNHSKIEVYIFYDPHSFSSQSKKMYENAVEKYGKGHVAMSNVTTEEGFVHDWKNMSSKSIKEVNLNYHGNNQTIMLNASAGEYITATDNGRTNKSGVSATNVKDLPQPLGNVRNAQLNLNTCKSNSTSQMKLKGSGKTLMKRFYEQFKFKTVRGTSAGVSYNWFTKQPIPQHPWKNHWDYMGEQPTNTYKEPVIPLYYRIGGMK